MSELPEPSAPLLSNYKYGLLRRRLFQVIFGGPRLRRVPCYVYLIQGGLWVLPLALSVPFIVLDALRLWNQYFLALVYGCTMWLVVLVKGTAVTLLRWHWQQEGVSTEYDDESDDVIIPSCCGLETVDFIFSRKRLFSVIFHPIVAGVLCFAGNFVLLPTVLLESLPIAGVVVVSLIGWFSVCVAQYSLAVRAPPETAVYRPVDPLELKFLNRPFHVVLLGCVFITIRVLVTEAALYLQLLYACLCLFPLGWVLGVLPPLDAFIPWSMEQVLTRLLGGSPLATDLRLLVIFIASVISVAIVVPVSDTVSFMLLTAFGFFLSQDIFKHVKCILTLLSSRQSNRIARFVNSLCKEVSDKTFVSYGGVGKVRMLSNLRTYLLSVLFSALKSSVLLAVSLLCIYFTSTVGSADMRLILTRVFSGLVIALCGCVTISDSLQRPYLLRLFRNCLYPKLTGDVAVFKAKKKRLQYASLPRRLVLATVAPLLMFALVGVGLSGGGNASTPLLWQRIATARVLRGIWQNSVLSLSELTLVSILILALPADNAWISLGLPTQALIIGLLLQITRDFLLKANFILISIVTYIWIRKHRANLALSVLIVGGSIVFLPLLVAIILISSILSAPLLSLFTLPIFSSSFPRPQRFWPSLANYGSTYLKSTEETIYYQQAEPEIAKAVHRSLSRGAVPSEPGMQLLLRFDNRLALVSLLEMGEGFCTLNLRGLELQETSCHSEEATKVDDMVEALHNPRSRAQSALNINIFNTLSPVDSVVIATYSEARNVLTGIIDQSSSLHQFSSNLLHTLVWTFNRHISVALEKYPLPPPPPPPPALDSRHELEQKTTRSLDMISERVRGISPITGKPRGLSLSSGLNEDHSTSHLSTFIGEHEDTISWCSSIIGNELPPVHDKRSASLVADLQPLRETRRWSTDLPPVTRKVSATPPLRHFWIDSAHNLLPQDIPVPAESREDLSMLTTTDHKHSIPTTTDPIAPSVPTTTDPIPTSAPSSQHSKIGFLSNKVSPQHSEDCISPLSWPQPPLSEVNIFRLMENFPHEWLSYLNDGLSQDSRVFGVLSRTVVGCFFLLDVPASAQTTSSRAPRTYPLDIYKRFCGDVPRSLDLNWMTDNPKIWELALKAYRYAVKLMYDEGSLGEVENWDELAGYLEEYEQNWCIVRETEDTWNQAILANTPRLFSLGRDREKDVYTAHVLSLQDEVVHIGTLNAAALGGIWTDLALELVYLTNDDEERYSIQAHEHLLRNLSIQTAEPPLGYTVYSSGMVSVPPLSILQ